MGHNYSGNHPRFSMAKPSSLKNIGKAITPGAAMGHPGSSLKKGGEVMHGSESGPMKNVLGPDNPHSHDDGGKVVMNNAMKMKTDDDGGGILASDSGAAGRELLYNQSKASGVKKKGEHKGY